MENIFSSFAFSSEGLSVQRQRLSAVAKNIANANTTRDETGKVYRREQVIVQSKQRFRFQNVLDSEMPMATGAKGHVGGGDPPYQQPDGDILKTVVGKDGTAPRMVYDPTHPDANDKGYVEMPNVNIVTEMVDMISAQRAFEANTGVVNAAKNMAKDSMDI